MANGRIIEAAKAAFTKPKIDMSGYLNGLTAIASGMIQREKILKERRQTVDAIEIDTNDEGFKEVFNTVKEDIFNGDINYKEGVKKLQKMANVANKIVPQIRSQIEDLKLKGFSGFSDASLENYVAALQTGELSQKIVVDGKEIQTLFILNPEDPTQVLMLGPDMQYTDPKLILNKIQNITTKDQGSKPAETTISYINKTYYNTEEGLAKWENESNAFRTKINNQFKISEKARNSYLFDYSFTINDGEQISFKDYYLNKALFDADSEAYKTYQEKMSNLKGDESERVKNMLLFELMKSDTNFEEDINSFVDEIVESKKPSYKFESSDKPYDPYSEAGGVIGEVDNMFSSLKNYNPQNPVKIFNNTYSIVRADASNENQAAAIKAKYGDDANINNFYVISGTNIIFPGTTKEGVMKGLRAFKAYQPKGLIGKYNEFLDYANKNINNYIAEPVNQDYTDNDDTSTGKINLESEQVVKGVDIEGTTYNVKKGQDGRFYVESKSRSGKFDRAGGKLLRLIKEKYN